MARVNLTKIDGSIGKVLIDNRDDLLNNTVSTAALFEKVNKLFVENKINTPKSREIEFKLKNMASFPSALMYVQNIIFKAAGLGV